MKNNSIFGEIKIKIWKQKLLCLETLKVELGKVY